MLNRTPAGREKARYAIPLLRGPLPVAGGADDPRATGAVFELFSATDETVARFAMPAERWKAQRGGRTFSFRNPKAPNATSSIAFAEIEGLPHRRSRLAVESHAVGLTLDAPQQAVGLRLTVGATRWCVVFRAHNFRRNEPNHVVAAGQAVPYGLPPRDCADKRIRWALDH